MAEHVPAADATLPPRPRGGKDAIVAVATIRFQRLGYHGTSMRDLARDCEITVASIYHHFASKQEILQDIILRALNDLISETTAAVEAADDSPREQLAALVNAWILFHTTRQAEAFVGSTELRSLDPQGREVIVALRDRQEAIFRDVIERGHALGTFQTAFPREATRAIVNMGYSVASWYDPRGELSPQALADRYATLALATVEAHA